MQLSLPSDNMYAKLSALLSEGRLQEALHAIETLFSRPPISFKLLLLKVLLLTRLCQPEKALACLDLVIEEGRRGEACCLPLKPEELYDAHVRKAELLESLQRPQEAINVYEKARALREHDAMLHSCIGRLLAVYQARYTDALMAFYRALEHAGGESTGSMIPLSYHLMNKGNALSALGRYPQALEAYRKAMGSQGFSTPIRPVLLHNTASTVALQGRTQEAIHMYEMLLHRDPDFYEGYLTQAHLEASRGNAQREKELLARAALLSQHRDPLHCSGEELLRNRLYLSATYRMQFVSN